MLFAEKTLQIFAAHILHAAGFDKTDASATALLAEITARYIHLLACRCAAFARLQNRVSVNFEDVVRGFVDSGIDLVALKEYCMICSTPGGNLIGSGIIANTEKTPKEQLMRSFPRLKPGVFPISAYVIILYIICIFSL